MGYNQHNAGLHMLQTKKPIFDDYGYADKYTEMIAESTAKKTMKRKPNYPQATRNKNYKDEKLLEHINICNFLVLESRRG